MNDEVAKSGPVLKKWQRMCYGLGDLACQFVWTFVGTYLTIYYTDIVGLAPAAVSMIMLAARLWDAVNDPMMGAVAERTQTKYGRFRPYIAFGAPILAVFGILTFTSPLGNGTAGVIWAAVTYIIAGMAYTVVGIPYASLVSVMTTDSGERNELNAYRSAGMYIGMIIVNFCSSGLMLAFSGGSETATKNGYFVTAVIYSVVAVPLFLIVFKNSKEIVQPSGDMKKVPISVTMKNVVENKYLMLISLIMLCQMTGYMGRIAVTSYYVIYCMGSFTMIGIIMGVPCAVGVIGALLSAPIVKKLGKKNALMLGMAIQGAALLIVYFAPFDNLTAIMLGHVIYGIASFAAPIMLSMVADSVDYQDFKTGVRTDGTAYATYGLASKAGNAIGAAVGVMLLSAFGYVANQQQTARAMSGINMVVNFLPACCFFAGALICLFWNLSDADADEIRVKLGERNAGGQQ